MKITYIFLAVCLLLPVSVFSQGPEDSLSLRVGYTHTLESEILEQSRTLFIHLPQDYDPAKTYHLVLILDAEVTFKSFASTTELMGWQGLIPQCIVVGIPNVNREVDHAPVIEGVPESGRANLMIRFYEKELFPFLASEFKIGKTVLWGHSWLGLFATYVMLNRPGLFDAYMATSPVYRFLAGQLAADSLFEGMAGSPVLFYITLGSEEPGSEEIKYFLGRLEEEAPATLTWKYKLNEGKNHDSNALNSYMDGLEWIFREWDQYGLAVNRTYMGVLPANRM